MLGLHPHQLPSAQPAASTLYACVYAWALEVAARLDIAGWFDSLISTEPAQSQPKPWPSISPSTSSSPAPGLAQAVAPAGEAMGAGAVPYR
jgi:hypothetical protein